MYKNTVINFHAVQDQAWIEKIMLLLKRKYNLISISELEHYYYKGINLKNGCHITFDDGDMTFYNHVYPLVKKYNIPVSIYVSCLAASERKNFWFQEIDGYDYNVLYEILSSKFIFSKGRTQIKAKLKSMKLEDIWKIIHLYQNRTGTKPKACMNMTVDQLREIHSSGLVVIGAHSLNHPILSNETDETVTYEIKESVKGLSHLLGTEIKYFSFPNGIPNVDFSCRELEILRDIGIKLSFSTDKSYFDLKNDPLNIPRYGISYGSIPFVIIKMLLGSKWKYLKKITFAKREEKYRHVD